MADGTIPRGFTAFVGIGYDGGYLYEMPGDWIIYRIEGSTEVPVANHGTTGFPGVPNETYGWAVSAQSFSNPAILQVTVSSDPTHSEEGDYHLLFFADPTHAGSFASEPYSGYFAVGPDYPPPTSGPGSNPPSCSL